MKVVSLPKPPAQKLLTEEQASSWWYRLLQLGLVIVFLGALGFLGSFLTRTLLTEQGIAWRNIQVYGLLLAFLGGVLFAAAASHFKIDLSLMTFERLLAIMRNEVYSPPEESAHVLRAVASALGSLSSDWTLYGNVRLEEHKTGLPFVLVGPPGVYGLELNREDPRKRHYADPAPALERTCSLLHARLAVNVIPLLLFPRSTAHYKNKDTRVKAFTAEEALAWLAARPASLDPVARRNVDTVLRQHLSAHFQ